MRVRFGYNERAGYYYDKMNEEWETNWPEDIVQKLNELNNAADHWIENFVELSSIAAQNENIIDKIIDYCVDKDDFIFKDIMTIIEGERNGKENK